ncbi:MAG: hypothetical protein M1826_005711 [Phylliscum demangeonii]|nr:MAG: hypothetical protein M1826_005711 [Phylliscum demangeonii]
MMPVIWDEPLMGVPVVASGQSAHDAILLESSVEGIPRRFGFPRATGSSSTLVGRRLRGRDRIIRRQWVPASITRGIPQIPFFQTSKFTHGTRVEPIKRSGEGIHDIRILNRHLAIERTEGSRLKAWHAQHPNHFFVQFGQTTPVDNRLNPRYGRQLIFADFSEYATVLGYGAIIEAEAEVNDYVAFDETAVKAKFMSIPGLGNRRYYGFRDLQFANARLAPGERMQVNFDEEQDETKAWNARVVDNVPITPIGATTVILSQRQI